MGSEVPFDAPEVERYWQTVSGLHPFAVRRRVLHVVGDGQEGIARYVKDASTFQSQGGWDVHVAAVETEGFGERCQVHHWGDAADGALVGRTKGLQHIVEAVEPEVVVLHGSKSGRLGRLTLRGRIPTVYIPHVWSFLSLSPAMAVGAVRWERRAARWTNLIVAVSEAQVSATVRREIHAPLAMVHNPVPVGWSRADDGERAAARLRLGLGPEPLAVSVGRLTRQKGHDQLLSAWPTIRAEVPTAQLVVVGDGPLRRPLAASAPSGVSFVGAVADPRDWVAAADVIVLPSRWEGMSLAMLEAMAAGRSVVINAVAGSEVVAKAEAGAVVPVGNASELAGAVAARLADRRGNDREGSRGAAYVAKYNDRVGCFLRLSAYLSRAHVFGTPAVRG